MAGGEISGVTPCLRAQIGQKFMSGMCNDSHGGFSVGCLLK